MVLNVIISLRLVHLIDELFRQHLLINCFFEWINHGWRLRAVEFDGHLLVAVLVDDRARVDLAEGARADSFYDAELLFKNFHSLVQHLIV